MSDRSSPIFVVSVLDQAGNQELVRPEDTEMILNRFHMKKKRQIDWNKQYEKALEAFRSNQIFILIDDHQAESLEEELTITSRMEVTFLKLTLLVGG